MSERTSSRKLLVEGCDDKRVIPELMEAHGVHWGETRAEAVVRIDVFDGIENILVPGVIEAESKGSGLAALGAMVDAGDSAVRTWARVRDRCRMALPDCPKTLPKKRLISKAQNGVRFGVWVMPDNRSRG